MDDPIEVVWTKTRWACQRDEMAWREAWFRVKALALFGRDCLRVLEDDKCTPGLMCDLMRKEAASRLGCEYHRSRGSKGTWSRGSKGLSHG